MKKIASVMLLAFLFLLSPILLAFKFNGPDAGTPGGWVKTFKLSTFNKSQIKNHKGEIIGEIEDFVMDLQGGRIALVIFSHMGMAGVGQKVKIIPYEFLSFDETGKNFVLSVSKEDLTSSIEVKNLQGKKTWRNRGLCNRLPGKNPFRGGVLWGENDLHPLWRFVGRR